MEFLNDDDFVFEVDNEEVKSYYFTILEEGKGGYYWEKLLAEVRANILLAHSDNVDEYILNNHDIDVYLGALCTFAERHFSSVTKEDIYQCILHFMQHGNRGNLACVIGKEKEHVPTAETLLNIIYDEIETIGREKFNDFEKLK